ncbi:capsid cement protein [uncultured Gemmobacter sp.]|jgi:hypothetical protein|uniref:capsid cement protein n=1 Tax=uncultured Gemmobacter sp. TaxID=1095917 RepID=UPI002594E741|nr:capsid cement protein [uncultured Gemmobacter sp.]
MIPTFIRAFEASAAIAGRRIVAFSDAAASSKIAQAATATAPALGVSEAMGAEAGGMCDVVLAGMAAVDLGGTVTAGAPLMADAEGKAIAASAAAATTRRVVGFAIQPGVAGDIIDIWLAPSLLDRA